MRGLEVKNKKSWKGKKEWKTSESMKKQREKIDASGIFTGSLKFVGFFSILI